MITQTPAVLALDSAYHQQWSFGRFSYLEQPRPNHGLLLLLTGGIDYVNQSDALRLRPMDLVFLPKGSRYEARFRPGTEDLLINFHIPEGSPALPPAPCLIMNDEARALLPLMERTVCRCQEGPGQFLEAMGLFYRFCQQICAMLQPAGGDEALIRQAKVLLSQPDCPSLDVVAKQLLISPSGLRKKFRDAEGISPSQYRMNQKVENARQLLVSTDLPVSQIAERCGFCDAAYFHRVFCRISGKTPAAYRISCQQQY